MSKYTISIYELVEEMNVGHEDRTIDEKIENATSYFFNFDYDMIDSETKSRFEKLFLKHYYLREIGFETIEMFRLKVNDRLQMILPRYNKLYAHQDDEINPYINSYLHEETHSEGTNENGETTNIESDDTTTQSDTPQGILTDLKEGRYTSYATIQVGNNETTTNGSGSNENDFERTIESLQGMTKQDAFRQYMMNLFSIDEMLVEEFSDLFMLIW